MYIRSSDEERRRLKVLSEVLKRAVDKQHHNNNRLK